jgi:flagellum-specific ATP synthase
MSTLTSVPALQRIQYYGTVVALEGAAIKVAGLNRAAKAGDRLKIVLRNEKPLFGEIIAFDKDTAQVMPYGATDGIAVGDKAWVWTEDNLAPCDAWLGQVVNAFGEKLTGGALPRGNQTVPLRALPPLAVNRRSIGERLKTGQATLDTVLPVCKGQRIGIFAGSGVGKSTLMGQLAQKMEADVVVIALVGERGREVRHFVSEIIGEEAMQRCVVVAATSDEPAPVKRRAAWMAMAVAEYFRDQGKHVLFMFDSITRFAEAHREIALTAGETPSLSAYPPSTISMIAGLCERSGTGTGTQGDITAIFTVLVAGSNMEEPVADMTRGILDGHIVLDRAIAERGRYPAYDVRRSVSRSLPAAATPDENALINRARALLGTYESAEPMIQIGLYKEGSDLKIDEAILRWPDLDDFFAQTSESHEDAFTKLAMIFSKKPE